MNDDIEQQDSIPSDSGPVEQSPPPEAAQAPQEPVASSPWDGFRALPQFKGQDDRAIAARLYQTMQREQAATRQLQQYVQVMPIAQEYLSLKPEFEKWRQMQGQQQQPAQPEKPKFWNPPEVKESYKRWMVKDEQGRDTIHPDAPFEARNALIEWQNYRSEFAQKFLTNPEEALGPMISEMAQKQAQEIMQQQLETRDREEFVSNFEKENADWLLDKETGSVSPTGLLFQQYVEEGRARGIPPGKPRAEYAVEKVELEMLRQKYLQEQSSPPVAYEQPYEQTPVQQQAPEPAPQPDLARQNMDYLRREASRNPSRSAGAATSDPRQPRRNTKMTFEQMLSDSLNAAGIRDDV